MRCSGPSVHAHEHTQFETHIIEYTYIIDREYSIAYTANEATSDTQFWG